MDEIEYLGATSTIQSYNLFTYCEGNPVNMVDPDGNWSLPNWSKITLGVAAAVAAVAATVITFGTAAPAATCTLTMIGMSIGASYAASSAVATAAVVATTIAAATYAGDIAYSTFTGESILLETVFQGNTEAYNIGATITSIATVGIMQAATFSPGVCFVANTPILSSDGYKNIDDIKVGDLVWSENPDIGEKTLKRVVQTFIKETRKLVCIEIEGEEIVTTPEHPFYSPISGWVPAEKLCIGDILVLYNGKNIKIKNFEKTG